MGVDMNKMRRGHQREQRGGEYLQLQAGETLLYIHPPCRPDDHYEPTDGVNYVPVVVHYGIGKNDKGGGRMVASLDPEINPILEHPFIKRYLKQRKIKISGECPVSKLLQSGDLDDKELDDMRASTRYVWGVTPIGHRSSSSDGWSDMVPKPSVLMVGKTVFDGIMEQFFDNGDITDPNEAILVIIKRTGEKMSTKYTVRSDKESVKKPKKLSKEVRAAIAKATKEDGDCDLFKVVSNMVKSPAEVSALISGVKLEDGDEDFDDEETDSEPDSDDDGEKELYESKSDDEDEEEDEDEKPAPKKGKAESKSTKTTTKPSSKPSKTKSSSKKDEDEEEDDDKPAKPSSRKEDEEAEDEDEPETEDEGDESDSDDGDSDDESDDSDDSDSDDEDDEDDDGDSEDDSDADEEEEPEEKPVAKKDKEKVAAKPAKSAKSGKDEKPKSKPAAEEDDDLGLSEIDAELERIATKGKDKPADKPSKNGKNGKKSSSSEARA